MERKRPDCDTENTIEITGMKPTTTSDTIQYYLESKRGVKAEVESIEFHEDRNAYLVTFQDKSAVQAALKKDHKVDGATLVVKKYKPPKTYPNKILVKGMSQDTTTDALTNYLEARTKEEVVELEFGNAMSGIAIATFRDSIELSDVQTACNKRALNGRMLTVQPVVETNCIIVRGYDEKTTESAIEYYFDNKKKSGVDGVIEAKMNQEDGYCLVYFENPEDALLASRRPHKVGHRELNVKVFHKCLGIPVDDEIQSFSFPDNVVINDIDNKKVKFLLNSHKWRDELEKQLLKSHGKLKRPSKSKESSRLEVECILTKETKDCRKLAKTWEEDTTQIINNFMESLQTDKLSLFPNSWDSVTEKVGKLSITTPDDVAVILEKAVCEIHIVGFCDAVTEVSKIIKEITTEAFEKPKQEKEKNRDVARLKEHQVLILAETDFLDQVKTRFKDMEVKLDIEKSEVLFIGSESEIRSAKVFMFETVHKIVSVSICTKSLAYIQFVQKTNVRQIIDLNIKQNARIGVWIIQDDDILMYSTSHEDASAAADILRESIVEQQIAVDNLQKSFLQSHDWEQLVKDIEERSEENSIVTKIVTDVHGQITVFCTSKFEADAIGKEVSNFLWLNVKTSKTYDFPPEHIAFLQEHMKEDIKKVTADLQEQDVIFSVKPNGIMIKGNGLGLRNAEFELNSLVKCMNVLIDKPCFRKLKQFSLDMGTESDDRRGGSGNQTISLGDTSERATFVTDGGQEVVVVKGDITGLDVDVIVNGANRDLQHKGGLARVIVRKGGKGIQDECDGHIKAKGHLSEGEIFCSKPGTLQCQMIIHAAGPVWKGGAQKEEEYLIKCVESSLAASEDNDFVSIAIPALCTGNFHYPPLEATNAIVNAVKNYFKWHSSSTIKVVVLCDVSDEAVNFFVRAGKKFFGDPKVSTGAHKGKKNLRASVFEGNTEIKIVKGLLAKMKVDVIVNTTSKDLKLDHGIVSSTILQHGGQILQQECSKKYPQGIDYGDVAVTTGGNLQCKIVCHGCLSQWRKESSCISDLEKFMLGCLEIADKKKLKKIAFPAMGTGKLGYPKEQVAAAMYKCIEQYVDKHKNTGIIEVLFVLYDKDLETVKAFEDEERRRHKLTRLGDTDSLLKGGVSVVYSRMSEEEKKRLVQEALEAKQQMAEELKETKDEMKKKEDALHKMQSRISKGGLLMRGEKEALEGNKVVYFDLYPKRSYSEGSAAETHFRLAESQFYRLTSGQGNYTVVKVQYVVNPPLVKQFHKAREDLKKHRGEKMSYPILAFHGTDEGNIKSIVENNFKVPGQAGFVHCTDTGYYGRGVYFSEYPNYSMDYIKGATKLLLCQVLPGKIYHCTTLIQGANLQPGHDSHTSPDNKELVIFNSHHILPAYIVHYTTSSGEFRYQAKH